MNRNRRHVLALAAGVSLLGGQAVVHAQGGFPNKPIRILIGYAPGGPLDSVARALAPRLSDELKQPVIVENRAGANGLIAAEAAVHAAPDGATLMLAGVTHAILPALNPQMPFDTLRDFTPIAIVGWGPLILAVNPDVPARSVAELVALSKTSKLAYGSAGNGTSTHIAVEIFKRASGAQLLHVPYKGSAPAIMDAIAGNVQAVMDVTATALPQVRAGKLRPLAVSGRHRIAELPDVPTITEAGFPGADVSTWWGILGPAGMPQAVVEKLNAALMSALKSPEVKARFANLGGEPSGTSAAEFDRILRTDVERFRAVVRDARIQAD